MKPQDRSDGIISRSLRTSPKVKVVVTKHVKKLKTSTRGRGRGRRRGSSVGKKDGRSEITKKTGKLNIFQ